MTRFEQPASRGTVGEWLRQLLEVLGFRLFRHQSGAAPLRHPPLDGRPANESDPAMVSGGIAGLILWLGGGTTPGHVLPRHPDSMGYEPMVRESRQGG